MDYEELHTLLWDARDEAMEHGEFDDEQLNTFIDIVLRNYSELY